MRSRLRTLLGLLAWTVFTANSLFPGLLHRCDAERVVSQVEASAAGAHDMAAMDMGGMHDMAAMPSHAHGGHDVPPGQVPSPFGDCHCVGHSCCSVVAAVPPVALAITATVVVAPMGSSAGQAVAPLTRPAFLLPQAQAPPFRV